MLLQALVKYYEILSEDEDCDIPKLGYSNVNVSYALNISRDGELLNVIPLKIPDSKGKKLMPQSMTVPEQVKRTVGINANFLCDNSSYVLGYDNKGKPERSKDCFKEFSKLNISILENVQCEEAIAMVNFLTNWDITGSSQHQALIDYAEDIFGGANLVFKLDGLNSYIHDNQQIKKAWEKYKTHNSDGSRMQCLVTGERSPIVKLHPIIRGLKGGQPMGNSLVSFNAVAYESYGNVKSQGLNSPISEYAAFAYGTALNYLLADYPHRLILGDSTVVYWAESKCRAYQDLFSLFTNPEELNSDSSEEFRYVRDEAAVKEVKSIFEKIKNGQKATLSDNFDKDTKFYILGLSPNAARISIRFFLCNTFGSFIEKNALHYENLRIQKQFENEPTAISFWRLLNETVSPLSSDKSASPLLSGSVMRSILTGSSYPVALYNAVMLRVRAEHDINYYKAAIIKACLSRGSNKDKYKEVLTVSLNPNSDNKAYVLGRLFAVLEKAQIDASSSSINSTIKDRYFTSACATPATVFPILLRLSSHHISKAEYGFANDNKIKEIMDILDIDNNPYPKNLSLEEQGVFILGYYHQKNSLYKKLEDK